MPPRRRRATAAERARPRPLLLPQMLPLIGALAASAASPVHNVFDYGAVGDGKANDTAAIQNTINAAAAAGGGVAWLPANGTFLMGGGITLFGHGYDGVSLTVDGAVTIPTPAWSTPAEAGLVNDTAGVKGLGFPGSLASGVLMVINVDGFRFNGHGSFTGYLFDEHKCGPTKTVPKPCPPGGFYMTNCTDLVVEDLHLSHFPGMMFIHNSQNVLVRNMTMINRNNPEETGDIEIGGIGSHGEPWNSPWQYKVHLMRADNITMRDSFVTGGDDNVCIKNDTANVLIENVTFLNGHGASIGSIPDCAGCHGVVTNITYRNLRFLGNAPMKIKWWANTTGEISNILFEDIYLDNASVAVEMTANYGSWACPCKWIHNFGGPGQRGKCRTYGPPFSVGVGGNCGPEGDATTNLFTRNITFRRITGTVQSPGSISCRKGNLCGVNLEDIRLTTSGKWSCANANVNSIGSVFPAIPHCPVGPNITSPPSPPPPAPGPSRACRLLATKGCFVDRPTGAGGSNGVLPAYQKQLHDIVTLGNCAEACFTAKDSLAGVDGGNHCWCGREVAAAAQSAPMAQCQASSCHGNRTQKCGGTQRMLVYNFTCGNPPRN